MARCVSSTVVGFLIPMLMVLSFLSSMWLTYWFGTSQRRKAKLAHEELIREKDMFKDKEIATHQAAVQRYVDEANRWKQEAEVNKAASDEYKRLLDANGVSYQRQTMLLSGSDVSHKRDSVFSGVPNALEYLKATMKD